jgi:hypothetical protein
MDLHVWMNVPKTLFYKEVLSAFDAIHHVKHVMEISIDAQVVGKTFLFLKVVATHTVQTLTTQLMGSVSSLSMWRI